MFTFWLAPNAGGGGLLFTFGLAPKASAGGGLLFTFGLTPNAGAGGGLLFTFGLAPNAGGGGGLLFTALALNPVAVPKPVGAPPNALLIAPLLAPFPPDCPKDGN